MAADKDAMGFFELEDDAYESSITTAEEVDSNPDFYKPNLKDASDSIYKARLRWIHDINNPSRVLVKKMGYYFKSDPDNPDRGLWLDCTSNTPGSKPNIITQAYWMMSKHESAAYRRIAKDNFSRKTYFWMLVYIMFDSIRPELDGTIKIMRFGKQIQKLHDKELAVDNSVGKKRCQFYHPLVGKDFMLVINKKDITRESGGVINITNYDDSYFEGQVTPFGYASKDASGNNEIRRVDPKSASDLQELADFLKKNSPALSQVEFVPWDDYTNDKAVRLVRELVDNDRLFDAIYFKTFNKKFSGTPLGNKGEVKKEDGAATEEATTDDEMDKTIDKLTNQSGATTTGDDGDDGFDTTTDGDFDLEDLGDDFDLDDLDD